MIGKKRIHAGYEDRRYWLVRLSYSFPETLDLGDFYAIHLNKAMDKHVVEGTYGWEIWHEGEIVWGRNRDAIRGIFPFESYDHMHLSLKDLSASVVLGMSLVHKVHKPPSRRRLVEGETLCRLMFDEQHVGDYSSKQKDGLVLCLKCYGPDRDKEREREKWLS